MGLKHKVLISVASGDGGEEPVIRSGSRQIRGRILDMLFGAKVGVLVMTPGESVESVEIREIGKGGTGDGQYKASGCCKKSSCVSR